MTDASEIQKRLEDLKREYRGPRSMIEMMEKGALGCSTAPLGKRFSSR